MKYKTHNGDLLYMKKIIILLSILIMLPINVNAGAVAKGAGVGIGVNLTVKMVNKNKDKIAAYSVGLITSYAIAKEVSRELAEDIIEIENGGLKYINNPILNELIYRARTNLDRYNVPLMTLIELDWIDGEGKRNLKSDNKIFNDAVIHLTKWADEFIDWESYEKDDKCKDPNSSDALLKEQIYKKIKIEPFMVNTYGTASKTAHKKEVKGDELEHDHIPSDKAVLLFMERKKNVVEFTKKEKETIKRNAITVTIPENLHKDGRTWGGRNKLLKRLDSQDLFIAFWQDYAEHFMNLGSSENRKYKKDGFFGKIDKKIGKEKAREKLKKAMVKHFNLNMELCLYESI